MNRQGQQPLRGMTGFGGQTSRASAQVGQGRMQNGGSQSGWSFGVQNGVPVLGPASSRTPLSGASFAQSLGANSQNNAPLDPSDFPSLSGSSPSNFANPSTQAVWSNQRPHGLSSRAGNLNATSEGRKGPLSGNPFEAELGRGGPGSGLDDFMQSGAVGMRGENPPVIDDFPPLGGAGSGDLAQDRRLNMMQAAANSAAGGAGSAQNSQDDTADSTTSPIQGSQSGILDASRQDDGSGDRGSDNHQMGGLGSKRDTLTDKYGLPELLGRIRSHNPNVSSLSIGHDLTQLGLDLSSNEPLWPNWGSPFASQPARPLTPDFQLPGCYKVGNVRPLTDKIPNFNSETLFIIFYQMTTDVAQEYAAYELTHRNWRYHKVHKFWFGRSQGYPEPLQMHDGERGRYDIFNFPLMRREMREMYVKWADIDDHIAQAGPFAPVIA